MTTKTKDPRVGKRIRLVYCADLYSWVPPGTLGTVRHVDAIGTLHVDWDDGTKLGLVPDEDWFEFVGGEDR